MYKIGDFSKITNLTVKALRYYDEQGLLAPSYRAENGYRYYDENDYETAQLIVLLRDLDFGIAEIKDVLTSYEDTSDLSYYLEAKRRMIEKRISEDRRMIKKLKEYIKPQRTVVKTDYDIDIKEIAPIRVASKRFMGGYHETGAYQEEIYREIEGHAQGPPLNCYHTSGYAEIADIEVCVPTGRHVDQNGVITKELPGITAICAVHKGSYDCFHYVYKAAIDYANTHKLQCALPTREIYHKGPGMLFMGNPNKYVTEILIPIRV